MKYISPKLRLKKGNLTLNWSIHDCPTFNTMHVLGDIDEIYKLIIGLNVLNLSQKENRSLYRHCSL